MENPSNLQPCFTRSRVDQAIVFATQAHAHKLRKGTDIPYITHPFAVAMILARGGFGEDTIIAGLLHDTVEDAGVSLEELRQRFGDAVANIVAGCSEPDKSLPWEERKRHTLEALRTAPLAVRAVTCADKLHNLRSLRADHAALGEEVLETLQPRASATNLAFSKPGQALGGGFRWPARRRTVPAILRGGGSILWRAHPPISTSQLTPKMKKSKPKPSLLAGTKPPASSMARKSSPPPAPSPIERAPDQTQRTQDHAHAGNIPAEAPPVGAPAKTVLLTVSGMSPAIITETVWKLANPDEGRQKIIPDEVVAITTTKGLADINSALLNLDKDGNFSPVAGWGEKSVWQTLREAILGSGAGSDPRLQLCRPQIIELPSPETGVKAPAVDIRTEADNIAAADFILERVVRGFVGNPDTRVVASIAGGRKTMGSLLYASMSLLGRETDRVTHVLVDRPFDECRGFFFPTQPVQDLVAGRENQPVRANAAGIDLADIPFVPLINRFRDLGEVPGGFMGLVRTYSDWLKQDAATAPQAIILIDRANCCVHVNDLACRIEGQNALEVLRFVFEANERGWVNEGNCRDFIVAAELFKASRGADFEPSRLSGEAGRAMADQIRAECGGTRTHPTWVEQIDSHKVSVPLSALRSFLKKKHSRWVPLDRQWRLPLFHIIGG